MPLTAKGEKIKANMEREYGPEKGERVFYAAANKGAVTGVHDSAAPAPLATAANAGVPQAPLRHRGTGGHDGGAFGSVSMNGAWRGRSV